MDTPLYLKQVKDEPGLREYTFNGTPVDCVKIGINECFPKGELPDIVVSGINHGANCSVASLYSGNHNQKVAVVGGGNVAMDAARCAKRLGAEVHIVYRRSEAELPARAEEVHHAKEEGIIFDLLTNPVSIEGDEKGHVQSMTCIRMELGEPDASGRRRPVPVEGSEFQFEVDAVIMALGTSPNPMSTKGTEGLEKTRKGCVAADEGGHTNLPGVFAGGDAATGAATVILAMGAGKSAAKSIDAYIKSKQ